MRGGLDGAKHARETRTHTRTRARTHQKSTRQTTTRKKHSPRRGGSRAAKCVACRLWERVCPEFTVTQKLGKLSVPRLGSSWNQPARDDTSLSRARWTRPAWPGLRACDLLCMCHPWPWRRHASRGEPLILSQQRVLEPWELIGYRSLVIDSICLSG